MDPKAFLGRKLVDRGRGAALVEHFLQEEHLTDGGEDKDEAGGDGQVVNVVVVRLEQKKIVRLVPSRLVGVLQHRTNVLVYVLQGVLLEENETCWN